MTSISAAGFPARSNADRNAFLFFISLVWAGVLSGFGYDSFMHVRAKGLDYPLIVHFHAVVFVSWLVLFTTQAALIRNGRPALHRRLGVYGAILAGVMLILGPATAIVSHARQYPAKPVAFMAVQFTDILALAVFTGSALLLRRNPAAHKRLMLLGLFYISDAAFGRLFNSFFFAPLGPPFFAQGFWGRMGTVYFGSDLLLLSFGLYDFTMRRTLHPAYAAGTAFTVTLQLTAIALLDNPTANAIFLHIIGR